MHFVVSGTLMAVVSALATLVVSVSASATDLTVKISELQKPDLVTIIPAVIDGQNVDIIKAGNLPEFSIHAELADASLNTEQKAEISKIRRDILDKTITGLIVGTSELPMVVGDEKVVKATVEKLNTEAQFDVFESVREGILVQRVEGESEVAKKKRRSLRERAAAFIAFLNENVLKSTYRAGKSFVVDSKGTKGFREFGLSVVVRGEFQVGIGKTNVMRTIARGLDIGYDIRSKELVIRLVKRHEKMDGGTAMALGPKAEIRAYRANLDEQEHRSHDGHVHGKTWYPPAPPLVTFASESYPGYHSIGTAVAFNVFDVVVPTYLFNTVNEFDADYRVTRISLSPLKYARLSVATARNWLGRSRPSANRCQAIFAHAP